MMDLQEFASRLSSCKKVVFFTGAGISTDSGVPDFRSPGGIWTKYQPVYFDEFCSSEPARRRYWKMKKELYTLYKDVSPNTGHFAIVEYEKQNQLLGVITQNIDGLHRIAGLAENKIIELHGTDRKIACLKCQKEFQPEAIYADMDKDDVSPSCNVCGGLLKPATISFGQMMPMDKMELAREWCESADLLVVLGSSLQVEPAASFPRIAHERSVLLGIINRDPTPLDTLADFVYHDSIGKFFKEIERG